MDGQSKLLELQLEKCVWLVKEERLRLGAAEMSSQHRAGLRRLMDEMRANCREYALLQGAGRSDQRKTAVRYSRLFQKAVDEYVASTQFTAPVVEYLDTLENLQENLVKVLKFQQRRKYTVQGAQETPCRCFDDDKKKKDALALVEQVAEKLCLQKNAETQTHNEPSGIDMAVQARAETTDQHVDATVQLRSVGVGDGILIADIVRAKSTADLQRRQLRATSAPVKATSGHSDPDAPPSGGGSLSVSSSLDNSASLGDLLTQFRRVLRDEADVAGSVGAPRIHRGATARRRFNEAERRLVESGRLSATASDGDSISEPRLCRKKHLLKQHSR